jgi:threonine aldolase
MTPAVVELRSDTFTRPTEAMRRAMYEAEVGDEVWDEDPTVDRLEELAARLMGKEAALFVSSGTQANLVGLLSHTQRGDEVILGDKSHIFSFETAGASVVGGLQLRPLPNGSSGELEPDQIRASIRNPEDVHNPRTGALALENTHNRCGGAVLDILAMRAMTGVARKAGIPVHLDGARVFNAAAALQLPASELVESADSVGFCLSKGLGAPVGSVLCGSEEYIDRGRKYRKMLGGGMRQAGVLAAAGLVALEQNVDRLAEDHANARLLAEGLAAIPGISVDPDRVQSNIVFFDITGTGIEPRDFVDRLWAEGVHLSGNTTTFRAVLSYEAPRPGIERALDVIAQAVRPVTFAGA